MKVLLSAILAVIVCTLGSEVEGQSCPLKLSPRDRKTIRVTVLPSFLALKSTMHEVALQIASDQTQSPAQIKGFAQVYELALLEARKMLETPLTAIGFREGVAVQMFLRNLLKNLDTLNLAIESPSQLRQAAIESARRIDGLSNALVTCL